MTDYERGYRDGLEAAAAAVDDEADAEQMRVSIRLSDEPVNLRDTATAIRALPVPQGGEATEAEIERVAAALYRFFGAELDGPVGNWDDDTRDGCMRAARAALRARSQP